MLCWLRFYDVRQSKERVEVSCYPAQQLKIALFELKLRNTLGSNKEQYT